MQCTEVSALVLSLTIISSITVETVCQSPACLRTAQRAGHSTHCWVPLWLIFFRSRSQNWTGMSIFVTVLRLDQDRIIWTNIRVSCKGLGEADSVIRLPCRSGPGGRKEGKKAQRERLLILQTEEGVGSWFVSLRAGCSRRGPKSPRTASAQGSIKLEITVQAQLQLASSLLLAGSQQ